MAAALWWFVWRRLDDAVERQSVGWGLYLTIMYAVALITAATWLLGALASVAGGEWQGWQLSLSNGLVWAGVLAWHRWMWRHPRKSPLLMPDVPTVVGAVFGLIIGVGGTVTAMATLLDTAIRGFTASASVGDPWWRSVLQSLVWAAGGGAIWWWHWIHEGGRRLKTGFADVGLVVVGILGAIILALGGIGTVLFVLLRLAFDRTDPVSEILEPLGAAMAAGAVGSLVWAYHRAVSLGRCRSHPAGSEAGDLRGWPGCRRHRNRRCGQFRTQYRGHSAGRRRHTDPAAGRHQRPGGRRSAVVAHLEARSPAGTDRAWAPGAAGVPHRSIWPERGGRRHHPPGDRIPRLRIRARRRLAAEAWWTGPARRSACSWQPGLPPDTTSRCGGTTVPSRPLPRPRGSGPSGR